MKDWAKILRAIAPKGKASIINGLAVAMPKIIEQFEINTALRQAHFLAQVAHESDGFQTTVEYASGDAYDTRTDLGNTAAKDGDGRLYKGYGLIQMTGKSNQKKAATELGIYKLWVKNPRILADFPYAALAAALYWKWRKLNALADKDDIKGITKKVNGGLNGYNDRKTYLARAKKALAAVPDSPHLDAEAAKEVFARDQVKALQEKLISLGYTPGKADGLVGSKTAGAITEFQHDNDLVTTGEFDPETQEKLWATNEKKPVPASRAESVPEKSRIVEKSSVLEKAAGTAAAVTTTIAAIEPVKQIEAVGQIVTQVQTAIQPFQGLIEAAKTHWYIGVIVVAGVIWHFARQIKKARIEDHQTGKTA